MEIDKTTIVTNDQMHTLYACWNQPPEIKKVYISKRTTSSLTISVLAIDPDEDDIRYRFYFGSNLVHDTDYVTQNQEVSYTVTGLSEDTRYTFYIIVDDKYEEINSGTKAEKTNCSGTGYNDGTYCSGTEYRSGTCTECTNGYNTYWCDGGQKNVSCPKTVTKTCSGPTICSNCNGTGDNPCTDSPKLVKSEEGKESCPNCGSSSKFLHEWWKCDTCGVSGEMKVCKASWDSETGKWCYNTTTANHPICPVCNGASSSTCRHGKTSSHSYEDTCSKCNGTGSYDKKCDHGYVDGHNQTETCSCCGGNYTSCMEYRMPCDAHGSYGVHYVCTTHGYDGKSSSHCKHGKNTEHLAN